MKYRVEDSRKRERWCRYIWQLGGSSASVSATSWSREGFASATMWSFVHLVLGCVVTAFRITGFLLSVLWERAVSQPPTPALPQAGPVEQTGTTRDNMSRESGTRGKIAVIGGGIAGCGAAWALTEDGFDVHLFEAEQVVGGNAKTHTWPDQITTGLSVLAWPAMYFRNYQKLLASFGIEQTEVELGFFVRDVDGRSYDTGNPEEELNREHANDFKAWERMIDVTRKVNSFFIREPEGTPASLYNMSMLNPLNVVPLWLVSRAFGVSAKFWTSVVVPMYASTFLSVDLDSVPAVIGPTVWDIMPLNRAPRLMSWTGDSRAVFNRLTQGIHLHCGEPVSVVRRDSQSKLWTVNNEVGFHRVVFASNARHVGECSDALPSGHRALFRGIRYTLHDDTSFVEGLIHSDLNVFPSDIKSKLAKSHANYIEAHASGTGDTQPQFANTFILSSWYPRAVRAQNTLPRLVTYNANPTRLPNPELIVGKVANVWNHPALTPSNLASLYLLRLIQGQSGLYFCGSLATPGNGHDLSLCSGFAVARAIGAKYPFAHDPECAADLEKLAKIMGL